MSETGSGPGIAPGRSKADRAVATQRMRDKADGRHIGVEQSAKMVERTPAKTAAARKFRDEAAANVRSLHWGGKGL